MTAADFRAARDALGLTQPQLAEMLDITRQTISRYENGRETIPRVVALAMERLAEMPRVGPGV